MSLPQHPILTSEAVAALPPPGLSGPSSLMFSPRLGNTAPSGEYLAFVASASMMLAHHPRRLEVQHTFFPSSTTTSSSTSSSSSSRSGSSSERQLFVLDMASLLSQWNHNRKNNTTMTENSNSRQTQQQQQQRLVVHPLLRIPSSNAIGGGGGNSSSSPHSITPKRRAIQQNATRSPSTGITTTITSTSMLASSFPSTTNTSTTTSSSSSSRSTRQQSPTRTTFPSITTSSLVHFSWCRSSSSNDSSSGVEEEEVEVDAARTQQQQQQSPPPTSRLRLLVPIRGSLFVQHGILDQAKPLQIIYDKGQHSPSPRRSFKSNNTTNHNTTDAEDPQLSPDGRMVAFVVAGDIYVAPTTTTNTDSATTAAPAAPPPPPTQRQQRQQQHTNPNSNSMNDSSVQITFGSTDTISHGVADFIAQEEMDRYRGFWWHPNSTGILFTKLDESNVPAYRILHQDVGSGPVGPPTTLTSTHLHSGGGGGGVDLSGGGGNSSSYNTSANNNNGGAAATFEDHRYPFAGNANPTVTLGYVRVDYDSYFNSNNHAKKKGKSADNDHDVERRDATGSIVASAAEGGELTNDSGSNNRSALVAMEEWNNATWYDSPREAPEYLARIYWLPDGSACAQWQNRSQNVLVLTRMNVLAKQKAKTLLIERSQHWINLHHMMKTLPQPIHPDDCVGTVFDNNPQPILPPNPLPTGSFSFLFASERTGYSHLYLYTYVPGYNGDQALLIKSVSGSGEWMVESIVGVDAPRDLVYVMGTYDSVLERHLYCLPIANKRRKLHPGGTTDSGDQQPNEEAGAGAVSTSNNSNHNNDSRQITTTNNNNSGVRRGLKQVIQNALGGKNRSSRNNSSGGGVGSTSNGSSASSSNSANNVQPTRLTTLSGMHNVVMDEDCRMFVDTSSDLNRPTKVQIYALDHRDDNNGTTMSMSVPPNTECLLTLYDALHDEKTMTALNLTTTSSGAASSSSVGTTSMMIGNSSSSAAAGGSSSKTHRLISSLPAPEILSFPTSDGTETLHAALYRPDPVKHGPGPYPLVCAVYGGPHVQRVNRSWSQCADMRAQRLCSLGFCVVKCDNRGSSRRGMGFESAISRRLGRIEVLDQVATVRQMTLRGIADPTRVGIYGWSYGGYLAAMCLCRAPDVFHVAVAGAPVTSWDGYDTHYTERYMGLPSENTNGYRESAVFDHVPNMRGKLMIVHGLIDENVHFRHTARLINRLIGAGKDYDLLIFPDERHSPRRLRDRIYMEQRISDYFVKHLSSPSSTNAMPMRSIPGHL